MGFFSRKRDKQGRTDDGSTSTAGHKIEENAAANAAYVPPPGNFPNEPHALLAYLQLGVLTPEQVKDLRYGGIAQYEAAVNAIKASGVKFADEQLADDILAAMKAALANYPA